MCPAAPPPESSRAPASDAAVQSAGSGVAGALGAALSVAGAASAAPVDALGPALGLGDEVLAGGADSGAVVPCGPHAASDAPKPTTAASANILPRWSRPAGVRCEVFIAPLLRSWFPESTSPAAMPPPDQGGRGSGGSPQPAGRPELREGLGLAGGAQERQAAQDQPGQPRTEAKPGRPGGAAVVRGR